MAEPRAEMLSLPQARERGRALGQVLRLTYRADPRRTVLALVPVWPLAVGMVAGAGQAILRAHGEDRTGQVLVAAAVAGVATLLAAVVGYWQAANGFLRMAQVISTEVDAVLLDHLGSAPTLDPFDDPAQLDRMEVLRVGRQPLVNVLAVAGGLVGAVTAGRSSPLCCWRRCGPGWPCSLCS